MIKTLINHVGEWVQDQETPNLAHLYHCKGFRIYGEFTFKSTFSFVCRGGGGTGPTINSSQQPGRAQLIHWLEGNLDWSKSHLLCLLVNSFSLKQSWTALTFLHSVHHFTSGDPMAFFLTEQAISSLCPAEMYLMFFLLLWVERNELSNVPSGQIINF